MTIEQAKTIVLAMGGRIDDDGSVACDDPYFSSRPGCGVEVDAVLSADQLLALATLERVRCP